MAKFALRVPGERWRECSTPRRKGPAPVSHPSSPRRARWALSLAATLAGALPAAAQGNPLTETPSQPPSQVLKAPADEAPNPSATAIIRSLAPFADGNPRGEPGPDVRRVGDGPGAIRVDYGHSVDLTVFFAYDSAHLTPEARLQLLPLGRALQSRELAPYRFLLGGNTDARGGAAYNHRLSLSRALAVKAFLIEAYGIDPNRLVAYGWGQSRLKDPAHPEAGVNRRVEASLIQPDRTELDEPDDFADARPSRWGADPGCARQPLSDPRARRRFALDDFGAMPTVLPCDR